MRSKVVELEPSNKKTPGPGTCTFNLIQTNYPPLFQPQGSTLFPISPTACAQRSNSQKITTPPKTKDTLDLAHIIKIKRT